MGVRYGADHRRLAEQNERACAENLLGCICNVRVYARHGNIARGTAMVSEADSYSVHTAYIKLGDDACETNVSGVVVGVLMNRDCDGFSLMLDATGTPVEEWMQFRIAEAVDFWECGNSPKIYCLREKSCGAVVFTECDGKRKYLTIRMNLGHCGLPKGHVEKFESEEDTAKREVLEETGVEITLIEGFRRSAVHSLSPRTTKEAVYFLGYFNGGTVKIQESEISSYCLSEYERARSLITYENDRMILDAAEKLLRERDKE